MNAERRDLVEEVTDLLYLEAELADANAYDDWLALWDEECLYWVPCNLDDYDPAHHVSIIYDDRSRLEQRCFRLTTGGAHAQEPASKSCRVVGNVRVGAEIDGVVEAGCSTHGRRIARELTALGGSVEADARHAREATQPAAASAAAARRCRGIHGISIEVLRWYSAYSG